MRIVCFHLNQIGDLAFSLPALKCLRDGFPDATITSVARPGHAELLECTGLVDEVLPRPGGLSSAKIGLALALARKRSDVAVVFSQSAECTVLASLTRARRRIGFVNTTLHGLLTERSSFTHPPSTENNLRLIEALGIEVTTRDYVGLLRPSEGMIERADRILAANGVGPGEKIVALSPGTSGRRRLKEWTDSGFAVLARHLTSRGFRVVILGSVPAEGIAREFSGILDLSGRTNLGEAVAVLARSETLVAVDSGILHLAAALGKKVVGLYGPSDPVVTGPQGDGHAVLTSGAECSPCRQGECRHNRKCMTDLSVDAVIAAVEGVLSPRSGWIWNPARKRQPGDL